MIDRPTTADPPLPLAGVRVVDLTMNISGPYATMILGDLGADVVKIERPDGGDDARRMAPARGDVSAYFLSVNRNKQSVVLDLRAADDEAALMDLLADADVFVTNVRPQKLAALGLDSPTLRARFPSLVYADISAYGNEGGERERAGYDMVLQARTGLMSVTGEPGGAPVRVGVSILDMGSGLWLALGVLAALRQRDVTGTAPCVSTSLLEVGAAFMAYDTAAYQMTGDIPPKRGSGHPAFAPYGVFQCKVGELALGVGADHIFARLAAAIAAPELVRDHRFSTNEARVRHREELTAELEASFADRTAEEWAVLLADHDVPADVVKDARDVLGDEQLRCIDFWLRSPSPDGSICVPGIPVRLDQRRMPMRHAPPAVGQHPAEPQGAGVTAEAASFPR